MASRRESQSVFGEAVHLKVCLAPFEDEGACWKLQTLGDDLFNNARVKAARALVYVRDNLLAI